MALHIAGGILIAAAILLLLGFGIGVLNDGAEDQDKAVMSFGAGLIAVAGLAAMYCIF